MPGTDQERSEARPTLAWLGLLLMIVAFIGLQLNSPRSKPLTEILPPPPKEPFAVVVLDPGHGGQDSGAAKGALVEKEITLDVAHRVERALQLGGLTPVLTRGDDSYVSLPARAAIANAQTDCVFISIHFDDAKANATGVETYYGARQVSLLSFSQPALPEPRNAESQALATFIQESLVARTQAVNRGTTPQQFFVITNVRHPAVLVEGGFLTNSVEMNKLETPDYREAIAMAITEGVIQYRDTLQQQKTPLAIDLPDH